MTSLEKKIINTHCRKTSIIITENLIKIKLNGTLRSENTNGNQLIMYGCGGVWCKLEDILT